MMTATETLRYGFNALDQAYVFKYNGQEAKLSITHPACNKFMKFLMNVREAIESQEARASVVRTDKNPDITYPYSVAGTGVAEQWENIHAAFRAEQE